MCAAWAPRIRTRRRNHDLTAATGPPRNFASASFKMQLVPSFPSDASSLSASAGSGPSWMQMHCNNTWTCGGCMRLRFDCLFLSLALLSPDSDHPRLLRLPHASPHNDCPWSVSRRKISSFSAPPGSWFVDMLSPSLPPSLPLLLSGLLRQACRTVELGQQTLHVGPNTDLAGCQHACSLSLSMPSIHAIGSGLRILDAHTNVCRETVTFGRHFIIRARTTGPASAVSFLASTASCCLDFDSSRH